MNRFFIFIAASFFAATTVNGQSLHIGVTSGLNTSFILDNGLKEDPRYNSTMSFATSPIGLTLGLELTPSFGISLESILANQELVYEVIDVADQIKGGQQIDLQYIHLPLMLTFLNGSNASTRFNFSAGPQLSILRKAAETYSAEAGVYKIPANASFADIQANFPTATQTSGQLADNTYSLPSDINSTELLNNQANDFKELEFQLSAAMGLSFDLGRHLMLSTQLRANYSISDMTNGDVLAAIRENNSSQILAEKAQLNLGFQVGVLYSLGITRSFKTEKTD